MLHRIAAPCQRATLAGREHGRILAVPDCPSLLPRGSAPARIARLCCPSKMARRWSWASPPTRGMPLRRCACGWSLLECDGARRRAVRCAASQAVVTETCDDAAAGCRDPCEIAGNCGVGDPDGGVGECEQRQRPRFFSSAPAQPLTNYVDNNVDSNTTLGPTPTTISHH